MDKSIVLLNVISVVAVLRSLVHIERLMVIVAVLAIQYAFLAIGNVDDAFAYYGSAAIMDLTTILLLSRLSSSKLSLDIQLFSFASILTNAVGFVAYELYIKAVYYNTAISVLLCLQLLRMLWLTDDDIRDMEDSPWRSVDDWIGNIGRQNSVVKPSQSAK